MTSIDIEKRFPVTTLKQLHAREKQPERWVFHDTVCSSLTLLYGRASVGKSYLVSSMLLSLLVKEREFLGMQPADPGKMWKPAILWTDPGSDDEYYDRIHPYLDGADVDVPMFYVGRTSRPDEWEALADHLLVQGHNFVVLDNLTGAAGDVTDSTALTTVFDGLTRLTNRGVPVVVLHHESEHGYSSPGAKPMGLSVITQKSRTLVQVRQTARRKLRGGNTALVVQARALDQPQHLVAEPLAGPYYRVIERTTWEDATTDSGPRAKAKKPGDLLGWLNTNCYGMTLREAAAKLATHRDKSESAAKQDINRAGIRKDGQGWIQRCTQETL